MKTSPQLIAIRVWDLPTRLFHWLLAALVTAALVTPQFGGDAMVWHMRCGFMIGALLVFRLIWGVAGSRWARFAAFVRGPAAVWRHLRGVQAPGEWADVGHSPLAALSVVAMLAVLALQVLTGLVADDEIAAAGPLVRFVSGARSNLATWWHTGAGQWLVCLLVALHLAAIVFYRVVKQRDLVGPMIHGNKLLPSEVPAAADGWVTRLRAVVLLALCLAGAAWVASLDT